MIPLRTACIAAAFLPLSLCASAQTEFVVAGKLIQHEQTSASQVSLIPDLPYGCELSVVDGPALAPAPSVSGPIFVGEPFHNGGVLGFNPDWEEWAYGFPNFNNYGTQTKVELDSLFGSGTYSFLVSGVNVSVNLSTEDYSANPPLLIFSGGAWVNGVYHLEESAALTVTTSIYTEFGTHAEDIVALEFNGCDYEDDADSWAGQGGLNFATLSVPANTLTVGQYYDVEAEFVAIPDFQTTVPGLPGTIAAATYGMITDAPILVVPDGGLFGTSYCQANPNSTGEEASIFIGGSLLVADNDVTLVASDLPPNQFGIFVNSQVQGFVQNPGGSQGNLCLAGGIGRFSRPGEIKNSGSCGSFLLQVDLNDVARPSGPVAILPGETWNFSCWFRDLNPTSTSNFTDGVTVTFQ